MDTIRIFALRDSNARTLFEMMTSEPLPEDAAYIVTSPDGWHTLTNEEFIEAKGPGLAIPNMLILSYYDVTMV